LTAEARTFKLYTDLAKMKLDILMLKSNSGTIIIIEEEIKDFLETLEEVIDVCSEDVTDTIKPLLRIACASFGHERVRGQAPSILLPLIDKITL